MPALLANIEKEVPPAVAQTLRDYYQVVSAFLRSQQGSKENSATSSLTPGMEEIKKVVLGKKDNKDKEPSSSTKAPTPTKP